MDNKAYLEGFSKTAETYGIDPVALYKYAQKASGGVVSAIKGFLNRRWDLLTGNTEALKMNEAARQMLSNTEKSGFGNTIAKMKHNNRMLNLELRDDVNFRNQLKQLQGITKSDIKNIQHDIVQQRLLRTGVALAGGSTLVGAGALAHKALSDDTPAPLHFVPHSYYPRPKMMFRQAYT